MCARSHSLQVTVDPAPLRYGGPPRPSARATVRTARPPVTALRSIALSLPLRLRAPLRAPYGSAPGRSLLPSHRHPWPDAHRTRQGIAPGARVCHGGPARPRFVPRVALGHSHRLGGARRRWPPRCSGHLHEGATPCALRAVCPPVPATPSPGVRRSVFRLIGGAASPLGAPAPCGKLRGCSPSGSQGLTFGVRARVVACLGALARAAGRVSAVPPAAPPGAGGKG